MTTHDWVGLILTIVIFFGMLITFSLALRPSKRKEMEEQKYKILNDDDQPLLGDINMAHHNPWPDEGNTGHIWDDDLRELDNPPPFLVDAIVLRQFYYGYILCTLLPYDSFNR